ncbi:MAG: hypothetical protein HGA37_08745 [Lentimicrobium sp.]|nr:hypothetical protein [Lentimicrobium sp.]
MKKQFKILVLMIVMLLSLQHLSAQSMVTVVKTSPAAAGTSPDFSMSAHKKGAFFLAPFYEFTHFTGLEMVSHTNYYKTWEGESSFEFPEEDITEYNDNFDTEYQNSMTAIKAGYQIRDGLGISGYVGVNHFNFKSWINDESSHILSTDYPALTLGLAVNYQKDLTEKLTGMAMLTYNYCTTGSVVANTNSDEEVISSSLNSMYWEANLAIAYRYKNFLPFAGLGFTQQFVHSVTEEQIPDTNEAGEEVYNNIEFDSRFSGTSFYGFAGLEYLINGQMSIYARSSFMNPLRANIGLRIVL